jgi:hypothetical protein
MLLLLELRNVRLALLEHSLPPLVRLLRLHVLDVVLAPFLLLPQQHPVIFAQQVHINLFQAQVLV